MVVRLRLIDSFGAFFDQFTDKPAASANGGPEREPSPHRARANKHSERAKTGRRKTIGISYKII